jgi:hypothetical protein
MSLVAVLVKDEELGSNELVPAVGLMPLGAGVLLEVAVASMIGKGSWMVGVVAVAV